MNCGCPRYHSSRGILAWKACLVRAVERDNEPDTPLVERAATSAMRCTDRPSPAPSMSGAGEWLED